MSASGPAAGWVPADPLESVDVEAFAEECEIPPSQEADLDECWATQRRNVHDLPTNFFAEHPPLEFFTDSSEEDESLQMQKTDARTEPAGEAQATRPTDGGQVEEAPQSGERTEVGEGNSQDGGMSPAPYTQQPITQLPSPRDGPLLADAQASPPVQSQRQPGANENAKADSTIPTLSALAVSASSELNPEARELQDSPLPSDVDSPRRIGRRKEKEWSPGICFGDGPVSLQPCTQAPGIIGDDNSPPLHLNEFDTPSMGVLSPAPARPAPQQTPEVKLQASQAGSDKPAAETEAGMHAGGAGASGVRSDLGNRDKSPKAAAPPVAEGSAPESMEAPETSTTSDRDASASVSSADQYVVLPVVREREPSSHTEVAERPEETAGGLSADHVGISTEVARKRQRRPLATSPTQEMSSDSEDRPVVIKRRRACGWQANRHQSGILPIRSGSDVAPEAEAGAASGSKTRGRDAPDSRDESDTPAATANKQPQDGVITADGAGCPSYVQICSQNDIPWNSVQQVRSKVKTGMDLIMWRWGLKKS